jgi:single-strand DNA-binding protein
VLSQTHGEFNIGSDIDLRFTPQGKAIANFRVVSSDRRKNQQTNEWEDTKTSWYTVEVWDKLAENVAESLEKGSRVLIIGKSYIDEYTTKDGETRYVPKIIANLIGPSLAFATAKVTKATRSGPSSGGGGGQGQSAADADPWAGPREDPWATPSGPPSGGYDENNPPF